ncbi:DUF262 domain-containing protein [Vibrio breoganii]
MRKPRRTYAEWCTSAKQSVWLFSSIRAITELNNSSARRQSNTNFNAKAKSTIKYLAKATCIDVRFTKWTIQREATMAFSKKLKVSAYSDPTKDTKINSIRTLNSMIDSNELVLPVFQTDIRWKEKEMLALYNYQLHSRAPVSPLSFNRIKSINAEMLNVTFIDREPLLDDALGGMNKDLFNVVDGQQRLTCNYKAYSNHKDVKHIYLDVTRGDFISKYDGEKRNKNLIPVGVLYNKNEDIFMNYIRDNNLDVYLIPLLLQVRTKFNNYNYSINNAQDLSFDEQIKWFEVLNLAGSRLPDIQMRLSNLQVKSIDFYKDYSRQFVAIIENKFKGLFNNRATEVSIPLAALNTAYSMEAQVELKGNFSPIASDAKVKSICRLPKNIIEAMFTTTLNGMQEAVDFIEFHSLKPPKRIDYLTYLQAYFTHHKATCLDLSTEQVSYLIHWYNSTNFSSLGNTERRKIFSQLLSK